MTAGQFVSGVSRHHLTLTVTLFACLGLSLIAHTGCGSGEREAPVVKSGGAGSNVSADYPLGKPAPRKLTGKAAKSVVPIDMPAGPGNK